MNKILTVNALIVVSLVFCLHRCNISMQSTLGGDINESAVKALTKSCDSRGGIYDPVEKRCMK